MGDEIFRAVVEHYRDGVLVYDPETGGILYTNPALERMLHYTPGELREMKIHDLVGPEQSLEAGRNPVDEWWLRRKDGSLAHLGARSSETPLPGRAVVCVLFRDEIRGGMLGSARFARSAMDSLSAHIAILDESGVIVATNRVWRRFAEANGVLPEMVSENANYLQVCDSATGRNSEEAPVFAGGIRAVLDGRRKSFELEYPCHSPTERRWFVARVTRLSGTDPPWAVVAHENITERKRAAEVLRNQKVMLEAVLRQAADAMVVCDVRGRFTFVNAAARHMALTDPDGASVEDVPEVWGKPLYPDGRPVPPEETSVYAALRGETTVGRELRLDRPDDNRYVLVSAAPLRDGEGEIVGAVVGVRDITERKRSEEERDRLRGREIEARTQREERRRIARDLHDMVLQDLSGALQSLRLTHLRARRSGAPLDLDEELGALRRATAGLRNAIHDLRHEEEQTFVGSVESLVELNRRANPERAIRLDIEERFPADLPEKVGVELLRVLQEALGNARRHSGARNVWINLLVEGEGVLRAEVSDDGVGFEPGSVREGVGLSVMRERGEVMGGEIEVSSRPGEGTRVTVRVPWRGGTPRPPRL